MSDALERLGGLPAEVRDADFALIARTTVAGLARALTDARDTGGSGYVSLTLPGGTSVGTPMALADAASSSPEQMCEQLDRLPAVSAYFAAADTPLAAASASPLSESSAAQASQAAARDCFPPGTCIRLTPGSGAARDYAASEDLVEIDPPVRITRGATDPAATVSLWLGDPTPLSVVIAPGTIVDLSPAPEPLGVTLQTGVALIDDMMRLRAAGRITEVATILGGLVPDDVTRHLDDHPAASALIGYGFLRTEEPEATLAQFQAAAARRPDLVDIAVLAGEVTARVGRHDEALEYFLRAVEVGLPAFSFGMNYLIDRLRTYGPLPGGPVPDPGLTAQARVALERIQVYAPAMLHGAVLTTYILAE